ncbi:hypothetical protein ACYOEI_08120 [Singulisphaera rosea]
MLRAFMIFASTAGLLLAVALAIGLSGSETMSGRGRSLLGPDSSTSALLMLPTIGTHGFAQFGSAIMTRRILRMMRGHDLPDWIGPHAFKNARKAIPFTCAATVLTALSAFLVAARGFDTSGVVGLVSATVSFNLGAFLAEYAAMASQSRLLREVRASSRQPWVVGPNAGALVAAKLPMGEGR